MLPQILFQNNGMSQIAMLSHHASSFQSLMCIPHRQIFHFPFYDHGTLEWPGSFHIHRHIFPAYGSFLLQHPHLLHGMYDLPAIETPMTLKMDASFFPSALHLPTDYKVSVNPDRNGCFWSTIPRTALRMLDGHRFALAAHLLHLLSPTLLLAQTPQYGLFPSATYFPELITEITHSITPVP